MTTEIVKMKSASVHHTIWGRFPDQQMSSFNDIVLHIGDLPRKKSINLHADIFDKGVSLLMTMFVGYSHRPISIDMKTCLSQSPFSLIFF